MSQAMKERQEFLAKESLAPETKDEMLRFAAEQFEYYASEHRAKVRDADRTAFDGAPGTALAVAGAREAAMMKAKVNTEMAAACRYAMSLPK